MEDFMKKRLELYIHIPFCVKKCLYCDFLSFSSTEVERECYVSAILEEISQYKGMAREYVVTSIFIGGGTPSVLESHNMFRIMNGVRQVFEVSDEAEITIEMNPGTIDEEKIKTYKALGINRVSIGLQATNDEELKMLGRIHSYEEFLETYSMVRACGISNINIDLISAIPKQTVGSWELTLDRVIALNPTHISAYSLIIEEGTPFYDNISDYETWLPSEEAEREMYHLTKRKLIEAGYYRYEISNYAKEGYECKHNLGYWDRVEYLGIGLGAASLIDNVRYSNERDLKTYMNSCNQGKTVRVEEEKLCIESQMEEFMFLGLRKIKGVETLAFEKQFQVKLEEVYQSQLEELCKQKLLQVDQYTVALTEKGIDVSNYVLSEFLF